ncbi:MAG: phosphate ABC transporter permease subunit PstC [Polyangiaceae bacterium]
MSSALALRRKRRWVEGAIELVIRGVALGSISAIVLIFLFVGREAIPILLDAEIGKEASLRALFAPPTGAVWQPVGETPKYAVLPLFLGSLKVTLVAMLFAAPLSVAAAIFVAEYAPRRARELIKPAIEMLAGVPSVVVGFFALVVLASWVQHAFGTEHRLNALVAGAGLAFAICPVVFTVADDALVAVPAHLRSAALALGSTKAQYVTRVVLPAAAPGIGAALILGLGRAIGETMIVLLASGNAAIADLSFGRSTRTVTATIAQELGEVVVGSPHYHVLFALGAILFVATLCINIVGERVVSAMRKRLGAT